MENRYEGATEREAFWKQAWGGSTASAGKTKGVAGLLEGDLSQERELGVRWHASEKA